MADQTIENLRIEIEASASNASSSLDTLIAKLSELKTATTGLRLQSVANGIKAIGDAINSGISADATSRMNELANALQRMQGTSISSSIANQIQKLDVALDGFDDDDLDKLNRLSRSLSSFTTVGRNSLSTTINQLSRIPDLVRSFNDVDIDLFVSQVNSLAAAFRCLTSSLSTASTGLTSIAPTIKSVSSEMAKGDKSSKSFLQSLIKFGKGLASIYAGAVSVVKVIKKYTDLSTKYVEDVNLFSMSMGEYTERAHEYAEQVADVMGIDPGEWMRSQGVLMTLAKGYGIAADNAYLISKNLTQLGYDMASFFNMDASTTMEKIQSAMSGEVRTVRQLGYDLSETRLKQIAFENGITKSVESMSQAEKTELRYIALMTQVTQVQGDMARTLDAPANQMRVLKAQIDQAGRALGNVFIPMVNAVLPYLIALAKAIRLVLTNIAALFGYKAPDIQDQVVGAAAGADTLADGLGEAAGNAKKLQRYLLGLDEINKMPSKNDSSSGSGSGASVGDFGGSLGIELPEYDFLANLVDTRVDNILNNMKSAFAWVNDLDFTRLSESFDNFMDRFSFHETTISRFNDFVMEKIVQPFVEWAAQDFAPAALDALSEFLTTVDLAVFPLLESLWTNFFSPLASWTGDAIINGLNELEDFLANLNDLLAGDLDLPGFVQNLDDAQRLAVLLSVALGANGLISTISKLLPVLTALNSKTFLIIGGIALLVAAGFWLADNWTEITTWITDKWNKATEKILVTTSLWKGVIFGLGKFIVDVVNGIWRVLKGFIQVLGGVFLADTDMIISGLGDIWWGLVKLVASPINAVIVATETFLNSMIDGINKFINKVNGVLAGLPSWLTGGNTWSISTISRVQFGRLEVPEPTQQSLTTKSGNKGDAFTDFSRATNKLSESVDDFSLDFVEDFSKLFDTTSEQVELMREQNELLMQIKDLPAARAAGPYVDSLLDVFQRFEDRTGGVGVMPLR